MIVEHPILDHGSLSNFSQLVDHFSAHEQQTANDKYEPIISPRLCEPLLIESVFNPAIFDESLFFDLFDGMAADAERAISGLFRVYIDGMLSPELENSVLYNKPESGESFQQFLTRRTGGRTFGVVVNGSEQWSDLLARFAARTFAPIVSVLGAYRTTIEVTLFIGNYGFTPFGIHIDDPYTSVVHFHVGPSSKQMTLFAKEDFHRLNGERKNCFEPRKLLPYGKTFNIRPGDLFLLPPHYYHIGYTQSFSIGVAVAISKYPDSMITKQILSRAVSAEKFAVPIDELINVSDRENEPFYQWVLRSRDEFYCQMRSRANLRYSYIRYSTSVINLDDPLILDSDFPITHVDAGDDLAIFARGNRFRLASNDLTRRLVDLLSEAPTTSINDLHQRLGGDISTDALQAVVQQLVRFRSLQSFSL